MKKTIILAGLLLFAIAHVALAEKRELPMTFHPGNISGKDMKVDRSPMRLPIDVIYDSDTHTVEVIGGGSIDAEVFIYDAAGSLVHYSSSLNTDFIVSEPASHTIQIQGDGWYAEGYIE